MNKAFSSFKEAAAYAKKMARLGCSSVKCTPCNDGSYEVTIHLPMVHTTVQSDENSSSKADVAISTQNLKIRASLKPKPKIKSKTPQPKKASVVKVKPGYCARCGKKIPEARLEITPNSKFCVPCLSTLENENPSNFRRGIDVDGIGGTRQDARRTLRNRHR